MPSNTLPPNAIALSTAVDWVTRWRATTTNPPVKGFLIPQLDISSAMKESGFEDIRAYMGIELKANLPVYHLLIVGVDVDGNDMVDPEKNEYVYDFTSPCPAICSATGPLK